MFGRKGQGAMEYLMTYGWAILVVMVVGIAMWRLGIFSMGSSTMTFTGFAKLKPQLSGSGINHDGTVTLVMTNGAGAPIALLNDGITATFLNKACNSRLACDSVSPNLAADCVTYGASLAGGLGAGPVAAGDNYKVVFGGPTHGVDSCATGTAGATYLAQIKIDYRIRIGTTSNDHSESGSIRGPLE